MARVIVFGDILQKFVAKSPATVMVRGLLEQLLNRRALDRWFEATAQAQYTRNILFSSLVGLMLQVVCRTQASVHAAYRTARSPPRSSRSTPSCAGSSCRPRRAWCGTSRARPDVIEIMNSARPALLPGYRLKYLDGNCLAASEQRLKPLRERRRRAAREVAGGLRSAAGLRRAMSFPVLTATPRSGRCWARSAARCSPMSCGWPTATSASRASCCAIEPRPAIFIIRQHGGPRQQAVGADAAGGHVAPRARSSSKPCSGFARG